MRFFKSKEEKAREAAEIAERVRNSECTRMYINALCTFFNEGDEHYQWLLSNSKEHAYKLIVSKDGVLLQQMDFNHRRYKETGTYTVSNERYGFGASGFEDLPNSNYVYEFRKCLFEAITNKCHNVKFAEDLILLSENAKKGW